MFFFFQVLQMFCTPVCRTKNRFASCECMIVGFNQDGMGTRAMAWFLMGSSLIPSLLSLTYIPICHAMCCLTATSNSAKAFKHPIPCLTPLYVFF